VPYDVLMPQLGMTMTEGSVVQWLKNPGDAVEKGEFLFIVQTDKVDMEIESPCTGTFAGSVVEIGQAVPVGTVIGRIAAAGGDETLNPPAHDQPPVAMPVGDQLGPPEIPASTTESRSSSDSHQRKLANPRAKKLARELSVDISLVPDYEGRGRIVEADVQRFFEESAAERSQSGKASERVDENREPHSSARDLRVVITDCSWEDDSVERKILEDAGVHLTRTQCTTPREVIDAAKDADALLVGWAPITSEVIGTLTRCRMLMRYGTGYDNIDVEAATRAGIAVAVNADYCVEEVATHALALLLACHRQLGALQESVRRGVWNPLETLLPFPPLSEQVVGILGFGRIGRHVGRMIQPLVKQVLVHDPMFSGTHPADLPVEFVSFDRLLAESDYISVHVPLGPQTHHLFNAQTIAQMKKGSYLINCARGPIIDEQALVDSLRNNHLAGAGLDVFSKEPLPIDHPLRSFPRVMITPHAAWYSARADHLLRANPARNILHFFRGQPIPLLNTPGRRKSR
jgi:D-3-phosphoglycerate dehydrogenase / 2-oxoglutarate reductase